MSYHLLIAHNVHTIPESTYYLAIILTYSIFLLEAGIPQLACAKVRPYSDYST